MSGNSGISFIIKIFVIMEDVGLRVTDGIRKDFEDVSLDMVMVLREKKR